MKMWISSHQLLRCERVEPLATESGAIAVLRQHTSPGTFTTIFYRSRINDADGWISFLQANHISGELRQVTKIRV
ncbi:hypothetical protein Hanom_Chr02g00144441 [Helianthus anomalus]